MDIGDLFFDDFSLEFSKEIKNRLRICGIGDKRVLKIEIELKNLMTTSKLRKSPKKLQKVSRIWKKIWSNFSQIHNKFQLISFKFQNTWSHLGKKIIQFHILKSNSNFQFNFHSNFTIQIKFYLNSTFTYRTTLTRGQKHVLIKLCIYFFRIGSNKNYLSRFSHL